MVLGASNEEIKADSSKLKGKSRGFFSTGGFDREKLIIAGKMRQDVADFTVLGLIGGTDATDANIAKITGYCQP